MFGFCGFGTFYFEIPSLNLDPISEKIESNTHSLHNLVSKIESLETQISSCLETAGSNVKQLNTYVDVTSSFIPLPPVSAPSSSNSYSRVVPKCTLSSEHRECNLILLVYLIIMVHLLKLRPLLMRYLNFLSVGQFR